MFADLVLSLHRFLQVLEKVLYILWKLFIVVSSAEDGTWIFCTDLFSQIVASIIHCCNVFCHYQHVLVLLWLESAWLFAQAESMPWTMTHWVHVRHAQSSLALSPRLSGSNEMCMGSKLHVAVIQGGGYYHTRRSKALLLPVCTHARLPLYFLTTTNNWTLCIWGTLEYSICEENGIEVESVITPTSAYVANSWYTMWLVSLLLCV